LPKADQLLVIRRSQNVLAPGCFCFPGGGIEGDESEEEALIRELREELNVPIRLVSRLWESVTSWKVALVWWQAEIEGNVDPIPNPDEVESLHWHSPAEMLKLPNLLESNADFLQRLMAGEIQLRKSS